MCLAIRRYHSVTGRKVGFKPAGGIKTVEQALQYQLVVKKLLGEEWMTPGLFRIGASTLLDDIRLKLDKLP
jgi:deoxyribose-phosphate aldolase